MAREVRRAPEWGPARPRHLWRGRQAGVLEDGHGREHAAGPPQGGSSSPVAANISRHDVLDLWAERWRRRAARGDMLIGRCADDASVGVEHRDDAERFWAERRNRVQPCHLARPPEKTRRIECGRCAAERRQRRGQGSPETFDLLGVTPRCSKTRTGKCTVRRQTIAKRLRQTLQDSKAALRERMHWPIPHQGAWRRRVLLGHSRDYAVPRHGRRLKVFREGIRRYGGRTRRRRSQRHRLTWQRLYALVERWLPSPPMLHPYPAPRLRVTTRGRSPVR